MPQFDQDKYEAVRVKTPIMHRTAIIERAVPGASGENPYSFYFSNEDAVEGRWIWLGDDYGYGTEILLHGEDNVDLTWIGSGNAPFLKDHSTNQQAAVIRGCKLDKEARALMVTDLLFSRSQMGQDIKNDIDDGVRKNVSVGYIIEEVIEVTPCDWRKGTPGVYHITKWTPMECSSVSIPAVTSVGFGRAAKPADEQLANETVFYRMRSHNLNHEGEGKMPPETTTNERGGAPAPEPKAPVVIQEKETDASRIHAIADLNRSVFPAGVEMGARAIAEKKTAEEFWREYQPELLAYQERQATLQIGMSEREKKRFSLVKLIASRAAAAMGERGPDVGYENEICETYMKARGIAPSHGGIIIPHEAMPAVRAAIISSGTGAGVVEEVHSGEVIEYLRDQSITARAGARVIGGLIGKFDMCRIGVGATGYWVAETNESGSDITTSAVDLDLLQFTMKTIGANQGITRQMMKQTSLDVEAIVRGEIFSAVADAIDLAALAGTGSNNQPTGVMVTSSVGTETLATANTPAWSDVVNMETTVSESNALRGNLAYVGHPTLVGTMKQTLKSSGVSGYIVEGGQCNGYPIYPSTNAVKATVKSIIFGNWAELMIGLWGGLEVVVDPYTYSRKGIVSVTAFQEADIQLRHLASFVYSVNPAG